MNKIILLILDPLIKDQREPKEKKLFVPLFIWLPKAKKPYDFEEKKQRQH